MPSTASASNDVNLQGMPARSSAAIDYAEALLQVTTSIREPLVQVESLLREQMASRFDDVDPMLRYVGDLGGKRLRPALVLLSALASGGSGEETIRLAAVLELVHTATLVHDDILDNAAMRRHRPTLHLRTDRFSSILVGDWLFTQAYALANEGASTIPGRWVARAAKEVCEGEIRQNLAIGKMTVEREEYLSILAQKTGSLCGVSCALGAWSAGSDSHRTNAFLDFGRKLGTAFQIHDDWLDYWGTGDRLGKVVGSDFGAKKTTLPMIRLLQIANPLERQSLCEWFHAPCPTAFAKVKAMLDRYQVGSYTREAARALSREAIEQLKRSSSCPGWQLLERLAVLAVERGA